MILPRLSVVLSIVAFALSPRPIASQQRASSELPTFHYTISGNLGRSNAPSVVNADKAILEGSVTARAWSSRHFSATTSLSGALSVPPPLPTGSDLVCTVDINDQDGGCKPDLPDYSYAGIQFGGETRFRWFSASLVSGPAAFHFRSVRKVGGIDSEGRRLFPEIPAATLLSFHTRAEATVHFGAHFGMVVSSTWRHLPHYRGAEMAINGVGLGLRVQ